MPDDKPWYSSHVWPDGYRDSFRWFVSAQEAVDDCRIRNEASDNLQYYRSNAFCSKHHCSELALTPDGLCQRHALEEANKPWCSHHVWPDGHCDNFRWFTTAQEAADDCHALNMEEEEAGGGNFHYYRSNAFCSQHRCSELALTPDGLCQRHALEEATAILRSFTEEWGSDFDTKEVAILLRKLLALGI